MNLSRATGFLTSPNARPLDLSVDMGAKLAIVGPPSSGKSRLLATLKSNLQQGVTWTQPVHVSGRSTPQGVVRSFGPDRATEALSALGLWDCRKSPISELSGSLQRMCQLLPCLAAEVGVVALDGELDWLDLWTLEAALDVLQRRTGAAIIVVTGRPDVASRMERVAVVSSRGLRAFGTPAELREEAGPMVAEIESENSPLVRAVAPSLGLTVRADEQHLRVTLDRGLDDAVRLCLAGYAAIRAVTIRTPDLAEAIKKRVP